MISKPAPAPPSRPRRSKAPLHAPGILINERYHVRRCLGHGAMGEVYLVADQRHDDVPRAAKYLLNTASQHVLDQFKREFATLGHLSHPNLTAVYDLEIDSENHIPFFTADFVVGQPFDEAVRGLPLATILELFVQALRALEYLHGHGVLHFDIKAANVLVAQREGQPPCTKIIDFGVAAMHGGTKRRGTPSYMAPEVVRETTADHRADLYSLGVLMYTALTKWNPFRGTTREDTYERHLTLVPPAPSLRNPSLPTYVDQILLRLLEKQPEDRYASAADVIADLNRVGPTHYAIETVETLDSYIPDEGPFVGRDAERALLQQLVTAPAPADRLPLVWIEGKQGTGKTRLLREAKWMAQMGECTSQIIDLQAEHGLHRLDTALREAMQHPTHAHWIGIDNIDQLMTTADAAASVETLQQLLQLLEQQQMIRAEAKDSRLMLVITATTGEANTRLKERLGQTLQPGQHISLHNFRSPELTAYIRTVTGIDPPPAPLVTAVWNYTEGNPFFVTEVLKALIRDGLLFDTAGRWRSTTFEDLGLDLNSLHIPATIEAAVAHDYARMTDAEQSLLGVFAVARQPLRMTELVAVSGHPIAHECVAALIRQSYVTFDTEARRYRFRTEAQRRAVYGLLGTDTKQRWHDRMAVRLEQDAHTDLEIIYWHQSGGSHPGLATQAQWALAQHYLSTHRAAEAIPLLEHLLLTSTALPWPAGTATLVAPPTHDADMALALARCQRQTHNFHGAMATLRQACERLTHDPVDHHWRIRLLEAWGITARDAREHAQSELKFREALQCMPEDGNDRARGLRLQNAIAQAILYQERGADALAQAIAMFRATAEAAAQLPLAEREQIVNNDLGHALLQQRDYAAAAEVLTQDVECFTLVEQPRNQCRALGLLAEACRYRHHYEAAHRHCEQAITIAKHTNDQMQLLYLYTTWGSIHLDQGHWQEAATLYERALDLSGRVGDVSRSMALTLNLGILHRQLKHEKRAEAYLRSTIAIAEGAKSAGGIDMQHGGRAHLELGDHYRLQRSFGLAHFHLDAARELALLHASCRDLMFYIVATKIETHRDEGCSDAARQLKPELDRLATTNTLAEAAQGIEDSLMDESTERQ